MRRALRPFSRVYAFPPFCGNIMEGNAALQEIELTVRWGKETLKLTLLCTTTLLELKEQLHRLTNVLPKRQKLLPLPRVGGKPPEDTATLTDLKMKPKARLQLIGTPEADVFEYDPEQEFDLEDDMDVRTEDIPLWERDENKRKLQNRIDTYEIKELNPARPNAKLTLYDHRSTAQTLIELTRPYLHEFLTRAYKAGYDIVIWSATSMRWVYYKMRDMGVLSHDDYKVRFLLDRPAMFTVQSFDTNGKSRVHDVKALALVWALCASPEKGAYTPSNTIMFDDLRRNFAYNPQTGLRIAAFRNGPQARATDRELEHLSEYLELIAKREPDFTTLDHREWHSYVRKCRKEM